MSAVLPSSNATATFPATFAAFRVWSYGVSPGMAPPDYLPFGQVSERNYDEADSTGLRTIDTLEIALIPWLINRHLEIEFFSGALNNTYAIRKSLVFFCRQLRQQGGQHAGCSNNPG
jgi:hypothetical protein